MKHVAPLRYGVIFKKAFCDPETFTAFVHDVLGIQLEIDKVETEKSFDPPIGKVDCRFDLFAEDIKNRTIVDIQHEKYADHYHRFLHYHCAAILQQAERSENYQAKLQVFTVVVLTGGDKHQVDMALTDFDPRTRTGKALGEIPHKIVYLNPKYVNEATPEPLCQWLRAIEDTLDEVVNETEYTNPHIQRVFAAIEQDQISPSERARMFDEYNEEELKRTLFEEGVSKGKLEGQLEGKLAGKLEIALALLAEGIPLAVITRVSGLSEAEIGALPTA